MNIVDIDHIELYVGDAIAAARSLCSAYGFRVYGRGGPGHRPAGTAQRPARPGRHPGAADLGAAPGPSRQPVRGPARRRRGGDRVRAPTAPPSPTPTRSRAAGRASTSRAPGRTTRPAWSPRRSRASATWSTASSSGTARTPSSSPARSRWSRAPPGRSGRRPAAPHRPRGRVRAGRRARRHHRLPRAGVRLHGHLPGVHRDRRAGHDVQGRAEPVRRRDVHHPRAGPHPPGGPDRRLPGLARRRRGAARRVPDQGHRARGPDLRRPGRRSSR